MSRLSKEIAEMCDAAGIGVYSTDDPSERTIFTGQFPEGIESGISILESPSPAPHEYVDTMSPILDFWSRSSDTDVAHELLQKVYRMFDRRYGYSTTHFNIYYSNALGAIVDADRDREAGKLYRLSVQFTCRDLATIS